MVFWDPCREFSFDTEAGGSLKERETSLLQKNIMYVQVLLNNHNKKKKQTNQTK